MSDPTTPDAVSSQPPSEKEKGGKRSQEDFFLESLSQAMLSVALRLDLLPGQVTLVVSEILDAPGDEAVYASCFGHRSSDGQPFEQKKTNKDEQGVISQILDLCARMNDGRPPWVNLTLLLSAESTDPGSAQVQFWTTSRETVEEGGGRAAFQALHALPAEALMTIFVDGMHRG